MRNGAESGSTTFLLQLLFVQTPRCASPDGTAEPVRLPRIQRLLPKKIAVNLLIAVFKENRFSTIPSLRQVVREATMRAKRVMSAHLHQPQPREIGHVDGITTVTYNSRMTTSDGTYVLYKDGSRRRYRRIAAKTEESSSHLQFFVEITEGEPFDIDNSDMQIVLCNTRSEAIAKAAQERESSLHSGWREYPDASL